MTNPAGTHPETPRDDVVEEIHGVEMIDAFRWLEDQNSPETRAWIDAQNGYTRSVLGSLPDRDQLRQRLAELMKVDTLGTPRACRGRYFFTRRAADQELFVLVMRESLHAQDQVLLDPHPLSPDHTTSLALWDISHDGKLVAFGLREGGEDEASVRLFDVDARQDLGQCLPKGRYFSVSILYDRTGLYYVSHLPEGPRLCFHSLTSPVPDEMIFGEGYGPEKIIHSHLSEDGRHLVITVEHGAGATRTELYVMAVSERGPIEPIVNDIEARFDGQAVGDSLFVHTDWEAPNGRILRVSLADPDRTQWHEIVPAGEDVIQSVTLAGGRLFVDSLRDVATRIRIFEADGRQLGEVALPGIGSAGLSGQWESDEAFFGFTSFHVPFTIFHYDIPLGHSEIWAPPNVPVDSSQLEVEQVWYKSKDGTRVPMFLVHRKGLALDGKNPTLLTGYGGFGASLTPAFSARAVVWAENGGVMAVPNLRGGGEFGEDWHRAGMREKKQNVFDDFISAAEWLIATGYTEPARLAIAGGSNGGLLVGAAMTQRPDLFGAVLCSYPLLDMLRYHRFLVAGFWAPEYGSSDEPQEFEYLHAYSPYHNVKVGVFYPATLFITGDADTRVDPLHARKMCALLQQATGSGKPVLLQYDTRAGHSGGRPLAKQIDDLADEIAFLLSEVGK